MRSLVFGIAMAASAIAVADEPAANVRAFDCGTTRVGATVPAPEGLEATFFGVTTVMLRAGSRAVMVDGFFTRPGIAAFLLTRLTPDVSRIDDALEEGKVGRVEAVLVAHSHHDHALDSAIVACKTGAFIVGSESTERIARSEGFKGDVKVVLKDGEVFGDGAFGVKVFLSDHSPSPPLPGEVSKDFAVPARVFAYKLGESYSFLVHHNSQKVLVHPSANFKEGMFKPEDQADVVFLSIGRLATQDMQFAHNYWDHVVKAAGAKLVIPTHWDDMALPATVPLRPSRRVIDDAEGALLMLKAVARKNNVPVVCMQALETMDIKAAVEAYAVKQGERAIWRC